MTHSFKQKFIGLFLLSSILFGNFSAFAQKRTGSQTNSSVQKTSGEKSAKTCNSGYQGTVNYTKIVATSSTGRYGSYTNMKRTYQTNIAIRDDGRQQGSTSMSELGLTGSFNLYGQATASVSEKDDRNDVSEKDDFCKLTLKGAQGKTRVHCESKYTRTTEATGTSSDANVYIGLKGRSMKLSIGRLPQLSGTSSTVSNSSCSGTCSPQKPVGSSSTIEVNGAGEKSVATDEDKITFNPQSFNRLSGSWSDTQPTPGGTVTETFQWNLSRCAPALEIANVTFEHKRVPDPNTWHSIDPLSGTVDGNIVKVKARVFNNGGETAYANVKFSETKSNEQLPDGQSSVAVNPGEYRDVEYEWDTSGYAWDENQKKQSEREIKAELEGGNTETAKIKILPKPIVMAHGLWSNAAAWAEYPVYMREIHSFAWRGYAVGADPEHGKMNTGESPGNSGATNTVYQNAQELAKQVKFAREENNAWHVDIVAHSMGGLISRQYINTFMPQVFDNKPEVTHLVMLGTPNQGSPCADSVNGLFEEFDKNDMQAMRELKPILVRAFNARINNRKGVKFSILIGVFVPRTCLDESEWGDGVVPLTSAKYNNTDYAYAPRNHIDLTGIEDFKGFVMPRIAIGPKKARSEQMQALIEGNSGDNFASFGNDTYQKQDVYGFGEYFKKASYKRTENNSSDEKDDSQKNVTTRQKVELNANESKEIEIPVRDGSSAGVVLVATPAVSATLKDASGAIVGESKGGMEAMKELFRTIAVRRQITSGVWKLKLENLGSQPATVFVAGITNSGAFSSFTVEAGKPSPTETIPLTAKLTENNAPVLNAKITANLAGQSAKIEFFDDGKHGDGAAGDGVYGASVEKLAKGEYFVEASATANNQTRNAVAMITVGGANPAVKTAAKPRRKS